jgi:glycerol-3-phosphate responsive antiterminator
VTDYQRIENTQNGVSDTCVTGYASALIEYRSISKELSDRTHELKLHVDKVKLLNSKAFALVNEFQRQSGELENIVSLRANLIQENQKQVAELRQRKSELVVYKARY